MFLLLARYLERKTCCPGDGDILVEQYLQQLIGTVVGDNSRGIAQQRAQQWRYEKRKEFHESSNKPGVARSDHLAPKDEQETYDQQS